MKSLFIGDLHIDDGYKGKHKDYMANCKEVLAQLTSIIEEEQPTHIFLAGDVIGVNTASRLLKSRDTLLYLIELLQHWNKITKNHVYTLRGNHDVFDRVGDFDVLTRLKLLKMCDHVDMNHARIHLVNYGADARELKLADNKTNVALMHTQFLVDDYPTGLRHIFDAKSINNMSNLSGVDLVLLGHVHVPTEVITTYIEGKKTCLMYLGCPTRPRKENNLWDYVNIAILEDTEEDVMVSNRIMELRPYTELFVNAFDELKDEDIDFESINNVDALVDVLSSLKEYSINSGMDYIAQVRKFEKIDKQGVEKAVGFIEAVKNKGASTVTEVD